MTRKDLGDIAELTVLADLAQRGYRLAIPYGDNWDYDILLCRKGFERVQVKYTESNGEVVIVRCRVLSVTNGKTVATKIYNPSIIDWMAVYDCTTHRCYYVPVSELAGKQELRLRLVPTKNAQAKGVLWAKDYLDI